MRGKQRCRIHGGPPGSGSPAGERNGRYRTGGYTCEAVAFRREMRALIRRCREAVEMVEG